MSITRRPIGLLCGIVQSNMRPRLPSAYAEDGVFADTVSFCDCRGRPAVLEDLPDFVFCKFGSPVAGSDGGAATDHSINDIVHLSASGQMAGVTARGVIAYVSYNHILGDLPAEDLVR